MLDLAKLCRRTFLRFLATATVVAIVPLAVCTPAPALAHDADTPAPRTDEGWKQRFAELNERAKAGNYDLVFLGDSITQGWNDNAIWKKHFEAYHPLNLGIGGDRTQHVLYRLQHGNIDGLKPKLVVLMIGTNNSNGNDNTGVEIADGIKAIVAELRKRLPETKVLLLAIFPRGPMPNPQREKNAEASRLASEVADGEMVHYLNIGDKFLAADGSLPKDIMPDYLHLSPEGYRIWAEAIEPKVKELMGVK
ncbi:MAG: GDSL family lipase [Pirellulales bacterium]|nr:GDSL family lipase [Pirellulales bacterium]